MLYTPIVVILALLLYAGIPILFFVILYFVIKKAIVDAHKEVGKYKDGS